MKFGRKKSAIDLIETFTRLAGSWTYDMSKLDLRHFDSEYVVYQMVNITSGAAAGRSHNVSILQWGIGVSRANLLTRRIRHDTIVADLSDYYPSVEWEILAIPARRHEISYQSCCPGVIYPDMTVR